MKPAQRPPLYGGAARFADTLFAWWLLRKAGQTDRKARKLKK